MAKNKDKKPRHQNLFVPVAQPEKEDASEKEKTRQKKHTITQKPKKAKRPPKPVQQDLPKNAILMPKRKNTGVSAAKRRKFWRRAKRILFLGAAVFTLLFYTTGTYLTAASYVAENFDTVRIALRGGQGFPLQFGLVNFLRAQPLGQGASFILGQGEAAIVSASGTQLRYLQHSYVNPGLATGKTRAVLYSRGGREYSVESRSKTIVKNATEQEILFCAISPNALVGVVTSSRYQANLQVLAPPYNPNDPQFNWPLVDEKPVALAFQKDNKSMVLGCVSAQDGTLGTTLYLLRTDKSQVQTQIRAHSTTLLQLQYLDNYRILAVYDTYAAIYSSKGQEISRYNYAHRRLVTANVYEGRTALVFGTSTEKEVYTVLLNKNLEPQFDVKAEITAKPWVMTVQNGVYLLFGQTVLAYTNSGALAARSDYEEKLLGFAYAGAPLLLSASGLSDISEMFAKAPIEEAPSLPPQNLGAPESVPLPSPAQSVQEQPLPEKQATEEPAPEQEQTQENVQ